MRSFNVNDGLPQSQVYDIHQDRRGLIWIATSGGGVATYDGREFGTLDMGHSHADGIVLRILEDLDGGLWFLTRQHVMHYDGRDLRHYDTVVDRQLGENRDMARDVDGNVWIGSTDGVTRIREGRSLRR